MRRESAENFGARDTAADKMTREQIAEAQKLASVGANIPTPPLHGQVDDDTPVKFWKLPEFKTFSELGDAENHLALSMIVDESWAEDGRPRELLPGYDYKVALKWFQRAAGAIWLAASCN